MRLRFLYIKSSREPWAEEAAAIYTKKISGFVQFELCELRGPKLARADAAKKVEKEQEIILSKIDPADFVVLFDEKGRLAKSSEEFSQIWVRAFENGRPVVAIIGGAFGVGNRLRARAQLTLSLSPLTMNHFVAQTTALEQIYRGLTIWKGVPYHNA